MRTLREPTEFDRQALRAMGHRIPAGCDQQGRHPEVDQRFREHEGDDRAIEPDDWTPLSWGETVEFWGGIAALVAVAAAVLGAVFWPY